MKARPQRREGTSPDGVIASSARAHERAAILLERMAAAHPEEAELHLEAALRHRRWAERDRETAERYAPGG
ncbi:MULTISPECIES: hypothetical protein [Actinomadura]|uniref:hypothetical protein n=1 Tax=Actinomadura TaxID=1988 RepID=UPI00040B0604|nr:MULTISPECIES: hypothetical protein [Actinomadura]RSN62416.1 hypothetical protein DMH08_19200 [Actinomadura sp. WAC 06369]